MDYRVYFTQRALDDLAEIVEYIAEDDSEAASRFGDALLDHAELLSQFPRMGDRVRQRSRVRKLRHSPVAVYYQIHESKRLVEILHIRHGSRKPPRF